MINEEMNYLSEILICLDHTYKTADKEIRKTAEKKLKEAEETILSHLPFIFETIKGNTLTKELSAALIIYIRNIIIRKRKENTIDKPTMIELIKTLVSTIISPDYPDHCLKEMNKCFEEIIDSPFLEQDSSIIMELMTLFQNKIKQNGISLISYKGVAYIFENILCSACVNDINCTNIIIIELDCSEYMLEQLMTFLNSVQLNADNQSQVSYYLDTMKVIYGLLLNISVHSRKEFKNIDKFLPTLVGKFQSAAIKLLTINFIDKADNLIKMHTKIYRFFISLIPTLPEYFEDKALFDLHSNIILVSISTLENPAILEKIMSNNFYGTYASQMMIYLSKICFRLNFLTDFQKYLIPFTKKIIFPLLIATDNEKSELIDDEEGTNYANYAYDIVSTRKEKGIKVSLAKFMYVGCKKCEHYLKFIIEYCISIILYNNTQGNSTMNLSEDRLIANGTEEQRIETALLVLCIIWKRTKNTSDYLKVILAFTEKNFLFFIEKCKESNVIKERFCLFISIYMQLFIDEGIDPIFYSHVCEFLLFNLLTTNNKSIGKYESAEALKNILQIDNYKDNFTCLSHKYISQFIQFTKEAKSPTYFEILAEICGSFSSEENILELIVVLFQRIVTEISPRRLSHSGKNEINMEKGLSSQYKTIINKCFDVILTIFANKEFVIKHFKKIEEMLSPLLLYMKYPYKIDFDGDIIIIMTSFIKILKGIPQSAFKLLPDLPQYLRKNKGLLLDLYELLNEYIINSNNILEPSEDHCRSIFKLFKKSFVKDSTNNKSPFLGCCLMQIWLLNTALIQPQIVIEILVFSFEQLDKIFKKDSQLSVIEQNFVVSLVTLVFDSFIHYHIIACNNINFDFLMRYLDCISDAVIYSPYEIKLLVIGICSLIHNKNIINNYPKIIRFVLPHCLELLKRLKRHEAKSLRNKDIEEFNVGLSESDSEDQDNECMIISTDQKDDYPMNDEDEYREIGDRSINPYKSYDEFKLFKESIDFLQTISIDIYHSWINELDDCEKAALTDILSTNRIAIIQDNGNKYNTSGMENQVPRKILKIKKH